MFIIFIILLISGCGDQYPFNYKLIWKCPANEKIVFIKTSNQPQKLIVITQLDKEWVLRTIGEDGEIATVAHGDGLVPPTNPLALSMDGNHCLVSWKRGSKYGLTDCDINKMIQKDITIINGGFTYPLMYPYSPDGKWIVLLSSGFDKKEIRSLWLVDRQGSNAKKVVFPKNADIFKKQNPFTEVFAGYTSDGKLAVFQRTTGILYQGEPGNLVISGKYSPCIEAYLTPDGKYLMSADIENDSIQITRYDIKQGKKNIIYKVNPANIDEAGPLEFQYASFNGEMTHNIIGPEMFPLHINKDGKCSKIFIDDYIRGRMFCGVAIWDTGHVAVVRNLDENSPDEIVILPVHK